jgi:ubiquinone/menaquinone biosynthesis C-methylase UbiE
VTGSSAEFSADFYRGKSWGTRGIEPAWDLPTLKLRYLLEALSPRAELHASLLEVGCGSGRILRSLRECDAYLALTGLDVSAEQIDLARKAHAALGIEYRHGDGERLPFADASFDFVIFLDYLEHIEKPQASLAEMYRVLRPSGTLHFVCPAEGERLTLYALSRAVFHRHVKEQTIGHIQAFSLREIEALVRGAGFVPTRRRYSYHPLGASMDYALFALLLNSRIANVYWANDKYHAVAQAKEPSLAGAALNALMTAGNALAYLESRALGRVGAVAAAVHMTAVKPSP